MAINIPETGLWSTIASALNLNFASVEGATGYATYTDTQYTQANPLVITAGAVVNMPNNASISLSDQIPSGVASLYNGSRLVSNDARAAYIIRVGFTVSSTSQTGAIGLVADISTAGDGSTPIINKSLALIRGANTPYPIVFSELYFSRETFVSNGAILLFESITGDSSIYDISYVIAKVHKGRV